VKGLSFLASSAIAAAVTACGTTAPPQDLDRHARTFIDVLAHGQLDSALALSHVEGNPDTVRNALRQGSDFIRPYATDSAALVGWNVVISNDTRGALTYETHAGPQWALVEVDVLRSGTTSRVVGFHWQPTAGRLADLNAFSLRGRSVAHYLFLVLAIGAVLGCVGGAVFAAVQRMGVFWVLFALIGVTKVTIDWTTGQLAFNPLSVQFLGAGYLRTAPVGPWFVSWSLPLGTLLALIRWRSRRTTNSPPQPPVAA